MKKLTTLWMTLVMLMITLSASAMSRSEIRENARFITDRMAYELNLSQMQYDDAYEVNYDFIDNVRHIMDDVVRGYAPAVDRYYQYLDYRNDDLRWILSASQYSRFMGVDYFYRPIYTTASNWFFRIFRVYTDVHHFYFGKPHHYKSYKGGHYRVHFGNVSYYKTHRKDHYKHDFYHGDVRQMRNPGGLKPKPGAAHKPGVAPKPQADRKPSAGAQAGRRPSAQRGTAGAPVSTPKADRNNKNDKPKVDKPKEQPKASARPSGTQNRRQSDVNAGSRPSQPQAKASSSRNSSKASNNARTSSSSRSESKDKQQEGRRASRGR